MIRALLVSMALVAASIAAAPTAAADPMSDLISMLPPGYAPDSCTGATQSNGLPAHVVVALDCSEVPGVVPAARYALHDSIGSLNHQFDVDFNGTYFHPVVCPGYPGIGPGTLTARTGWKGRMGCGTLQPDGKFAVMWTNSSGPLWARARGTDPVAVINWFNDVIIGS